MLLCSIKKTLWKSILDWSETFVLCSLTPWRKLSAVLFHPLSHMFAVTAPCSLSVSFQPTWVISNILIPRPLTQLAAMSEEHVLGLTAQGYLKGCANFALFTAPINSVCFGGSLCDVWMLDVGQSMANMQPCCLALCV